MRYVIGAFMPKHLLKNVEDALDEFIEVLMRIRRKKSTTEKVKDKAKKMAHKVEDHLDEISYRATRATKDLKDAAKDMLNEPSTDEKLLRKLKRAGENLEHNINRALKHASELGEKLKEVLIVLKDTIVDTFKQLSSAFKSIFSTTPQPRTFSPHHQKGKEQHLAKEHAFKAKQIPPQTTGAHLKILARKGK